MMSDTILKTFNSYHSKLQFTIEHEIENILNFLDLEITKQPNDYAKTNWYRKPTFSGRYLNFHSHHPLSQKKAIVYNITDRCILLSDPQFHKQNLHLAKSFLINNDCTLKFINKHIQKRLHHLNNKNHPHNSSINNNTDYNKNKNKKIIVLSFFKNLYPQFNNYFKNTNFKVIYKMQNKLNNIIGPCKDKTCF